MLPQHTKISSDGERVVSTKGLYFFNPLEYSPPRNITLILHTIYGKCIFGKWDDKDCKGWLPYPQGWDKCPKYKED